MGTTKTFGFTLVNMMSEPTTTNWYLLIETLLTGPLLEKITIEYPSLDTPAKVLVVIESYFKWKYLTSLRRISPDIAEDLDVYISEQVEFLDYYGVDPENVKQRLFSAYRRLEQLSKITFQVGI